MEISFVEFVMTLVTLLIAITLAALIAGILILGTIWVIMTLIAWIMEKIADTLEKK